MIYHVSISAKDPRHVADVLAELMGGRAYPFPGSVADSFMAVSGDEHGTLVEVYPEGVTLVPGQGGDQVAAARQDSPPAGWPFHFLLSVPADRATIERIGAREGWRTQFLARGRADRPFFHVIEFWIENRLMVELVTAEMAAPYLDLIKLEKLDAMLGRDG